MEEAMKYIVIGLVFVVAILIRQTNKRIDGVIDNATEWRGNEVSANNHNSNEVIKGVGHLKAMIVALCPHEECEYSAKFSIGCLASMCTPIYKKKCVLCGNEEQISKEEYDEAIRDKEVAEIARSRADLNERMKDVRTPDTSK